MIFRVRLKRLIDGRWQGRACSSPVGDVLVTAGTREAALEKLRKELRYRSELCPCSTVPEDYVQLGIVEQPPSPWRGGVL